MIEQSAPTTTDRITCSIQGPLNERGHPKLLADLTPEGISVWCRRCKKSHVISKERCIAAWERGESVQCVPDEGKASI